MLRKPMILRSPDEPAAQSSTPAPVSQSSSSPSPAPSSSPPEDKGVAAAAAEVLSDPDVDSNDDFGDLTFLTTKGEAPDRPVSTEDSDDDGISVDTKTKAAPPPATQSGAHVAPAPVGAQPTVITAPAAAPVQDDKSKSPAPAAAPAATPQPGAAPAPAAAAPATGPASEADPLKAYQTWRDKSKSTLAETSFKLSEEDAQALQDEPEKVLPRLAAEVYMTTLENVTVAVQQAIPAMIENVLTFRTEVQKKTDEFFGAWPNLKDHHAKAMEIGKQWRALNPTASVEDFIKNVGPLAHQMLGVPLHTVQAAPPAPKVTSLPPHVPLAGGATTRVPANKGNGSGNIFEELALAAEDDEG